MADARAADLPELTASVVKLEQDRRAVEAALVLPYSQGQTEGQINQLKTLKRMTYGRANFDLLRKRFLLASWSQPQIRARATVAGELQYSPSPPAAQVRCSRRG